MIRTTGLFDASVLENNAIEARTPKTPNAANTMFRMPKTVTAAGRCIVFPRCAWSNALARSTFYGRRGHRRKNQAAANNSRSAGPSPDIAFHVLKLQFRAQSRGSFRRQPIGGIEELRDDVLFHFLQRRHCEPLGLAFDLFSVGVPQFACKQLEAERPIIVVCCQMRVILTDQPFEDRFCP